MINWNHGIHRIVFEGIWWKDADRSAIGMEFRGSVGLGSAACSSPPNIQQLLQLNHISTKLPLVLCVYVLFVVRPVFC
jgi:hypothetical protein